MKKGDVWWADIEKPVGRRPVVLISRDHAYRLRTSVTVAPTTRTIRDIPVEVSISQKEGMPKNCVVNLDNIFTIRKDRLLEHICSLSSQRIDQIDKAIKFALDID